jgi:hypothetical protein
MRHLFTSWVYCHLGLRRRSGRSLGYVAALSGVRCRVAWWKSYEGCVGARHLFASGVYCHLGLKRRSRRSLGYVAALSGVWGGVSRSSRNFRNPEMGPESLRVPGGHWDQEEDGQTLQVRSIKTQHPCVDLKTHRRTTMSGGRKDGS